MDSVTTTFNFDNIPPELKTYPNWVCGRDDKSPVSLGTGSNAKSNDPGTWGTFGQAVSYFQKHKNNGIRTIGFEVGESPFVGIDLDHCIDFETATFDHLAIDVIKILNTYTEISPSGTGIRMFVKGKIPEDNRKSGNFEIAQAGKYFSVTGRHLDVTPKEIAANQEGLTEVYNLYFKRNSKVTSVRKGDEAILSDETVMARMFSGSNGEKIRNLFDGNFPDYPSQSEADLALCCRIAFWSGRNLDQVDRIFRQSKLFRAKWDERHFSDGRTYGEETLRKALSRTPERFTEFSEPEEWPDPLPLDKDTDLPDFPVEALPGVGREMVEVAAKINQVDIGLAASIYLGVLSAACAKTARVDLGSHEEPVNLYLCPILDSGNRKSATEAVLSAPLYDFQRKVQEELAPVIRDAALKRRLLERRLDALLKKAASGDFEKRPQLESQAKEVSQQIDENPVPKTPLYLMDDCTPEKLGDAMADNGERMAIITTEAGIFETMSGRYDKGTTNIDLFLKSHSGDSWAAHRIGRDSKTMANPTLTLTVSVQSQVIEEIGANKRFQGRGLLARFLYSKCKSFVGSRTRQTMSIPSSLKMNYGNHITDLLSIPLSDARLCLSPDAQALWDEFYNYVEAEMKPGNSLCYLHDWGSKLPGAVARIAGLLHLAEHGSEGLLKPISASVVSASCMIGRYFLQHALAVFDMMREDPRLKVARRILTYIKKDGVQTFQGRDAMRHTHIPTIEEVMQGIRVLIDRGIVREDEGRVTNMGGRPQSPHYLVNPKIL